MPSRNPVAAIKRATEQKTKMNMKKIEEKANKYLAATHPEHRPESKEIRGQRIQSVAVAPKGYYEGLTTNGHRVYISTDEVASWIA